MEIPLNEAIGLRTATEAGGDAVLLVLEPRDAALASREPAFLHGGALATCVEMGGWQALELAAAERGQDLLGWHPVAVEVQLLRTAKRTTYHVVGAPEHVGRTHAFARVEVRPADGGDPVAAGTVTLVYSEPNT